MLHQEEDLNVKWLNDIGLKLIAFQCIYPFIYRSTLCVYARICELFLLPYLCTNQAKIWYMVSKYPVNVISHMVLQLL